MKTIQNVEDTKDADGKWKRSYMYDGVRYFTRGGMLWSAVSSRTKPNGATQQKLPNYQGVINQFTDFQSFVEWCHCEFGYLNKENNGRFWSLDKDILVFNNKIYSPETCCFVPNTINSLLINCTRSRGILPLGVSFRKDIQKFSVQVADREGGRIVVNGFHDPMEAHRKYQEIKIKLFQNAIKDFQSILPYKTTQGLQRHLQLIEDDFKAYRETIR